MSEKTTMTGSSIITLKPLEVIIRYTIIGDSSNDVSTSVIQIPPPPPIIPNIRK